MEQHHEPTFDERHHGPARHHHAELWAELTVRGYAVIEAAGQGRDAEPSRAHLLDHLVDAVVPHLHAEERMVYSLALRSR